MDSNGNLIVFISNLQLQWTPMVSRSQLNSCSSNGLQWQASLGLPYIIGVHWSPLESMESIGVEDFTCMLVESIGVGDLVELVEFVPNKDLH